MIKLKNILFEVFNDIREAGSKSSEYEYEIEFDDVYIPGLSKSTDVITVNVEISYNLDPGCPGRYSGRPEDCYPDESASVELTGNRILEITVTDEHRQETKIDIRFLHPQQLKTLQGLVDTHVDTNSSDIESTILDGWNES